MNTMVVLPEWGGARGGIYSVAHGLMRDLRDKGVTVFCLLGCVIAAISKEDQNVISKLGVTIIEPDVSHAEKNVSPQARVQDKSKFDEYYKNNLCMLQTCNKIVSLSKTTKELALYLFHSEDASQCQLIVFGTIVGSSDEEVVLLAELVRSANFIFSTGYSAYESINSEMKILTRVPNNTCLIPKFPLSCDPKVNTSNQIFIPLIGGNKQTFLDTCMCAINSCNSDLKDPVDVVVQMQIRDRSLYPEACPNCSYCVYSSMQEVEFAARNAAIVIASGQFTENGFSGLEFLMMGKMVLVPDGTDVATLLLESSSPEDANLFILHSMEGIQYVGRRRVIAIEWEKKIQATLKNVKNLRNKIAAVANRITKFEDYTVGQSDLAVALFADGHKAPESHGKQNSEDKTCDEKPKNEEKKVGEENRFYMDRILELNLPLLGQGSCGTVYKCNQKTAIKCINTAQISVNTNAATREINALRRLEGKPHINIISLKEVYVEKPYIYITMDLALTSMEQFMEETAYKQLTLEKKIDVMRQLFSGLSHLHYLFIVHQDIKPSNILFTENNHVKISDFGTARLKKSSGSSNSGEESDHHLGTPYYQAPEVCCRDQRAQPCSDVWSGCLVGTEWYAGKKAWARSGPKWFMQMKQTEQLPCELTKMPDKVRNLLKRGLNYLPNKRPSAKEFEYQLALYSKYPEFFAEAQFTGNTALEIGWLQDADQSMANTLLSCKGIPLGTFITRPSGATGGKILSIRHKIDTAKHQLISKQNNLFYLNKGKEFQSLQQLIQYYKTIDSNHVAHRLTHAYRDNLAETLSLNTKTYTHPTWPGPHSGETTQASSTTKKGATVSKKLVSLFRKTESRPLLPDFNSITISSTTRKTWPRRQGPDILCLSEDDNYKIGWIAVGNQIFAHEQLSKKHIASGTFMTRPSDEQADGIVLSMLNEKREVENYSIERKDAEFFLHTKLGFASLTELVGYYQTSISGHVACQLTSPFVASITGHLEDGAVPLTYMQIREKDVQIKSKISDGPLFRLSLAIWKPASKYKIVVKHIRKKFNVQLDLQLRNRLNKEAAIMHKLRHPHVISLLGMSSVAHNPAIVMEYMNQGDLRKWLQDKKDNLKADTLGTIASQISGGMYHLEKRKILHRNLQASNILMDSMRNIKIAAFGSSIALESASDVSVEQANLPWRWSAIEVLARLVFSSKSDVWSFGILMWELYTFAESVPYQEVTEEEQLCSKLQTREYRLAQPTACPDDIYQIMKKCWIAEPKDRPTFAALKLELS